MHCKKEKYANLLQTAIRAILFFKHFIDCFQIFIDKEEILSPSLLLKDSRLSQILLLHQITFTISCCLQQFKITLLFLFIPTFLRNLPEQLPKILSKMFHYLHLPFNFSLFCFLQARQNLQSLDEFFFLKYHFGQQTCLNRLLYSTHVTACLWLLVLLSSFVTSSRTRWLLDESRSRPCSSWRNMSECLSSNTFGKTLARR